MSVKDMRRSDWHRVLRRDYIASDCLVCGTAGKVSLTVLRELTSPLTIHYPFGDALIADKDYAWLQIALKEQYFWLTAMYDADGQLIQLYFDITDGNCFEDEDNPCFPDMYLDIVVTGTGEIHVIDREDLDWALDNGVITRDQYDHAWKVCDELCQYLEQNKDDVVRFCNREFKKCIAICTESGE